MFNSLSFSSWGPLCFQLLPASQRVLAVTTGVDWAPLKQIGYSDGLASVSLFGSAPLRNITGSLGCLCSAGVQRHRALTILWSAVRCWTRLSHFSVASWADNNRCPMHLQSLRLILSVQFEMPVVCPIQVLPCPVFGSLPLRAVAAPPANTASHPREHVHVHSCGTQVWGPRRPPRLPDLRVNATSLPHAGCCLHVTSLFLGVPLPSGHTGWAGPFCRVHLIPGKLTYIVTLNGGVAAAGLGVRGWFPMPCLPPCPPVPSSLLDGQPLSWCNPPVAAVAPPWPSYITEQRRTKDTERDAIPAHKVGVWAGLAAEMWPLSPVPRPCPPFPLQLWTPSCPLTTLHLSTQQAPLSGAVSEACEEGAWVVPLKAALNPGEGAGGLMPLLPHLQGDGSEEHSTYFFLAGS